MNETYGIIVIVVVMFDVMRIYVHKIKIAIIENIIFP